MGDCKYFAPTLIDEALNLLADNGKNIIVLAGGTDLVHKINYYDIKPSNILHIDNLGLDGVEDKNGTLIIGATTKTAELAENSLIAKKAPALARAAQLSGSSTIRNAATIGGNIVNGSPGADLVPPLMVMNAEFHLKSKSGDRVVPIKEFFTGARQTVRKPEELLTEIHIPQYKGNTAFVKLGRRKAMTLSVVNAATCLDMKGDTCNGSYIAVGCVAPTVLRCEKAESMLKGQVLSKELILDAASEALDASAPIDDQRATAWYRKKAGIAVVAQALAEAANINLV